MEELSVLTYNVLFNKAISNLKKIVREYKPDILCLQEIETNEESLKKLDYGTYKLADYSNSFFKFGKIYGVATLYNEKKLKLVQSDALNLPKNVYEIILTLLRTLRGGNKARTSLETDFRTIEKNKSVIIYNIHLTALATNHSRTKQLKKVLHNNLLGKKTPTIISGDFNYLPYQRKDLEELMDEFDFKEATQNISYTYLYPDIKKARYNWLQIILGRIAGIFYDYKLKMDYTFYKGLKLKKTARIEVGLSDHYPIISYFNL